MKEEEIVKILDGFTDLQLLKIGHEINRWKFPEELKAIDLEMFSIYDEEKTYSQSIGINPTGGEHSEFFYANLSPIRLFIEEKFGTKKSLRYHNTVGRTDEGKMTNDEFENWWSKRFL